MLSINLFLRGSPAASCGLQRRYSLSWNDCMLNYWIFFVGWLAFRYKWLPLLIYCWLELATQWIQSLRTHVYSNILSSYASVLFWECKTQYSYCWWLVHSYWCILFCETLNKECILESESEINYMNSRYQHLNLFWPYPEKENGCSHVNTSVASNNGTFSLYMRSVFKLFACTSLCWGCSLPT